MEEKDNRTNVTPISAVKPIMKHGKLVCGVPGCGAEIVQIRPGLRVCITCGKIAK